MNRTSNSYKPRRPRRTKRLQEIVRILIKYGLEDFVKAIGLGGGVRLIGRVLRRKRLSELGGSTVCEHVRMAFEELGPTFIKLGQILSIRQDMIPEELVCELERLQDNVPPFPAEQAMETVRKALPRAMEDVFTDFEPEPFASASIAQVHRAVLRNGRMVAVKVKRPNIDRMVAADVRILQGIAALMERYLPNLEMLRPIELVREFKRQINRELDLNHEFLNMQRARKELHHTEDAYVPRTYRSLSSDTVLVMDYVHGVKISSVISGEAAGYDKKLLSRRLTSVFLTQVFRRGFFHADPHPGNILVLPDNTLCLLDHGMMGTVSPEQRRLLGKFLQGVSNAEPRGTANALLELSTPIAAVDRDELTLACHRLTEDYATLPLEYFNMEQALKDVLNMLVEFKLKLPANVLYLIKALGTAEGISRKLDPEFSILEAIRPFATKTFMDQFSPKKMAGEFVMSATEYARLLCDLPLDARDVLTTLKRGRVTVEVDAKSMHSLRRIGEEVAHTFTFGIILAGLLVSSSLVVQSNVSPKWLNMPAIGFIGYVLAGLIALGLIVSMIVRAVRR